MNNTNSDTNIYKTINKNNWTPVHEHRYNTHLYLVQCSTHNLSYPIQQTTTFTYDYTTGQSTPLNDQNRNRISGGDYPAYINPR